MKSVVQIQNLPYHSKRHYEIILNLKFKPTKYSMLTLRMECGEILARHIHCLIGLFATLV